MPKLVFKLSGTQSLDFPLAGDHVRLGRNAANDIVIDNSWISSFHAEFRLHPDGVTEVRDLHSSNGTTVNGERIESIRLSPGDSIAFGQLEAIFDPVPENLSGANGSAAQAAKLADPLPPPAALKGTRNAKSASTPGTQPVLPLPRPVATQPVPSPGVSHRQTTPGAIVPPVAELPADVRRDLQQAHAELAGMRSEMKSLAEKVETLRRENESEEQNQARIRLQGEREARELRTRLERMQEEIEKSESAAAEFAKASEETLSADQKELIVRVAELKSTSESTAAAIKAQEARLTALKSEEAGLSAVSGKLDLVMKEAVELGNRNAVAASALAGAESKAAAMEQELAGRQGAVEAARSEEAEVTAAVAAAAQNLKQLHAQTAAATDSLTAGEAELSAILQKRDVAHSEAEAFAVRLADQKKAADLAAGNLAKLNDEVVALTGRRVAVESEIKTAEEQLAEQNAKLESAAAALRELENAESRLIEIEAAIADSTARAKAAADAAIADAKKEAALAKELSAAKEEQEKLDAAISKAAGEFAALESRREKAAAELADVTSFAAKQIDAAREASALLETTEKSISGAERRLAELREGEAEAAAIAHKVETVRRELANCESNVAELDRSKASLAEEVEALTLQKKELAAAKASLEAVSGQLTEASAAIAQRQAQLAKLDMETAAAGALAVKVRETQAEASRAAKEVAEHQQKLAVLVADISAMAEKRSTASRALADSTAQMESLTRKMAAIRAETEALEQLRAEAATLKARADELDQKVHHLEDRQQTFSAAPDANWGTVHAISKAIIKQVDLLDDLIQHHVANNGSRESIEQMTIFRAGLADILAEYNVEPYRFEPGFSVDVSTRKKIQIVESREERGEGTRIEKTWRPGYICTNGVVGVQTLLRKAEVSIVIGK